MLHVEPCVPTLQTHVIVSAVQAVVPLPLNRIFLAFMTRHVFMWPLPSHRLLTHHVPLHSAQRAIDLIIVGLPMPRPYLHAVYVEVVPTTLFAIREVFSLSHFFAADRTVLLDLDILPLHCLVLFFVGGNFGMH